MLHMFLESKSARRRAVIAGIAIVVVVAGGVLMALRTAAASQPARNPLVFDRALPAMDGAHLNMKVVDLHVAPGQVSAPHKHGCAVVVYVISGRMKMSVRGGTDSVYGPGQTFHETPTDIHQVSSNASATDSAHFTATFVCDHAGPLTTPVP